MHLGELQRVEAVAGHVDVAGVPLISRQNDRTTLQEGDAVGVELDPSVLHLFGRDGRALSATA